MHIIWAVLGLLGAVWILFLLQMNFRTSFGRAKRHGREPRDITSDMVQSCPHCGQFYGGSPKSCPHCKKYVKEDE